MSNITQTFRGKATTTGATSFTAQTVTTSATPLDETSLALPSGTKSFILHTRERSKVRVAASMGDTAISDSYFTVNTDSAWAQEGLNFDGTLYLATEKASVTIEVLSWQ